MLFSLLVLLFGTPLPVFAVDDPLTALGLEEESEEPLVTTSRFPRPVSKIAENITVVTADDIARINAHTLAEVLQTVSGVQLDKVRTPGSWTFFSIHGDLSRHIQLLIDGVPQNILSAENSADVGMIPVQAIERIEIIKGAASVAWGQALGGVVNVVTKSPDPERTFGGLASASAGEKLTTDLRGEVSGTVRRLGYYLSGGNLHSDGLLPGNRFNFNHGYAKFVYGLPDKGSFTLGLDFRDSFRGVVDSPLFDFHDSAEARYRNGFLAFNYPLGDRLLLEMDGRLGTKEMENRWGRLSNPEVLRANARLKEDTRGAGLRLTWGDQATNLAAGLEYEHDDFALRDPVRQRPESNFDRDLDRFGAYLNGAYTLGPLTILPGIRYDHTGLDDNALSYNLGATWRLTDKTVLRAYGARGYSLPVLNGLAVVLNQNRLQQIWTAQVGVETEELPYLWLKGTLFYNDTWRIQEFDFSGPPTVNLKEEITQGFELEARTVPVYGFSLAGSYTFADIRDRATDERLRERPPQGAKLALTYDNDRLGLRGTATGNYVRWNAREVLKARDTAMIWDLHLNQKLRPCSELSPELFLSVHNLFNGSQYQIFVYPNTPRWIEGGMRFRF